MRRSRVDFFPKCPYCDEETRLIYPAWNTGTKFVDCERCGQKYAIKIAIQGLILETYALVKK